MASTHDYAIVSSSWDPQIDQYVVIAAGIGKSGTEAAADFLTDETLLEAWFNTAQPGLGRNTEVVLSTEVIEGHHGPPHVVASYSW